MKKSVIHKIIFVIPVIYVFWGAFVYFLGGPVFLSRIDPEFMHLLNGLNCAILEFDRIGHVDLPGTPFQLITGFFIWIIYFISGHGSIVESVFSNPEMYFTWMAFILTIITSGILYWLGKTMIKNTEDLFGTIVLQSSLFLSLPLIDLPYRYFPDRLLVILMLIFIILCLKLFYGNLKTRKFSVWSGIIMGVGLVTKFVFLPFLIIPLILIKGWKEKAVYLFSLALSSFVMFLPVINKSSYFFNFISGLITHDGQYGGGEKQVLNLDKFVSNLDLMFFDNIVFLAIIIVAVAVVVILTYKSDFRKKFIHEYWFLIAVIITTLLSIVMVGKHYKDYYLDSLLIMGGFIFYILWRIGNNLYPRNYTRYIFYLSFAVILLLPLKTIYPGYQFRQYCFKDNDFTHRAINRFITNDDFLLLEPSWESGPFLESGFVFGFSYVYKRELYFNQFEKFYPNLLTYEGPENVLKYARMIDADNEAIIKSGKSIFIHSTPGRNAQGLIRYMNKEAAKFNTALSIDTVFINIDDDEYLIRLVNEDWESKKIVKTGFENIIENQVCCDNKKVALKGEFVIEKENVCNGFNSIKLGEENNQSPKLILENVRKGDYIELTIKRKINNQDDEGMLVIGYADENQKPVYFSNGKKLSPINSDWEILRLSTTIETQPQYNYIQCYYQYKGPAEVYIDDFTVKHFGRK